MKFHLFFLTLLLATNPFANPNIVVSIKPIHSIVSNLTQGVSTPKLLLSSKQSAHHAHLKPSQLSHLEQADLVIIVHPDFEQGLSKSIRNIPAEKILTVDQSMTSKHDEHDEHDEHDDKNHHSWLSIQHIQQFAQKLGDTLIQIDPKNKATYQGNLHKFSQKLTALKLSLQQQLSNHANQSLITYNNAFEHFIKSQQLKQIGSVSQRHGENLSIFKILKAKKIIQKQQTSCLLFTTEIPQKRINTLTEGLVINTAEIDIIGFDIQPGADHYFKLMQNITQKVEQCLK
jgi:zinc transport system substrate-binding protein